MSSPSSRGSKSSLSSVSSLFGGAILHLETPPDCLHLDLLIGRTSGHIFGGGGQFPEEGSSFIHYQCAPSASISLNIFLLILSFTFVSCRSQRTKGNPVLCACILSHMIFVKQSTRPNFQVEHFMHSKRRYQFCFTLTKTA